MNLLARVSPTQLGISFNLNRAFWKALQLICRLSARVLILLQAARLQGAERNGGGRSDESQILKVSCHKVDTLSHYVRFVDWRWLIMWSSVGAAFHERRKGFTVLANGVARQKSIGAETTRPSSRSDWGAWMVALVAGRWWAVCFKVCV